MKRAACLGEARGSSVDVAFGVGASGRLFFVGGRRGAADAEGGAAAAESALELFRGRGLGAGAFRALLLGLVLGLAPLGLLARESDLALAPVDAEDLDLDLVADLDDLLGAVDLVVG